MDNNNNSNVTTTNTNTDSNTNTDTQVKTYTQDEVLALIQSESDKRVTAALKTAEKKYQKQLSLSQLDGVERERAEAADRISELEQKLADYEIEKNRSELKSVLSSRGLSAEFADIIQVSDSLEDSQANIDKLDKLFKAAVRLEVENRLAATGNTPATGITGKKPMTKEEAMKMSIGDLTAFSINNPEEFKTIFGV